MTPITHPGPHDPGFIDLSDPSRTSGPPTDSFHLCNPYRTSCLPIGSLTPPSIAHLCGLRFCRNPIQELPDRCRLAAFALPPAAFLLPPRCFPAASGCFPAAASLLSRCRVIFFDRYEVPKRPPEWSFGNLGSTPIRDEAIQKPKTLCLRGSKATKCHRGRSGISKTPF